MDISLLMAAKGLVLAVLGFGFMIFVHELGHFLAAKLMGVRVEKFSFGMGPKAVGRKWGQTEYMISWVPIGGYVRMAGGDEGEETTGAPDEFVSKSPGRRALIIAAGPAFSILFGIPLMMGVYLIGLDVPRAIVSDVVVGSPAWKAGLKYGDRIKGLDGQPIAAYDDLRLAALETPANEPVSVVVERDGKDVELSLVRPRAGELGVACAFQSLVVDRVAPDSPAEQAGVKAGDVLVSVGDHQVRTWSDFRRQILARPRETIRLGVLRDGKSLTLEPTPRVREVQNPGFTIRLPREIGFVRPGFAADGTLKPGDEIVAVNGAEVSRWWEIEDAVAAGPPRVGLSVQRGGETLAVELDRDKGMCLTDSLGIAPRPVYIIDDVHGATDPQVSPGDVIVKAGDDLAEAIPEGGLLYVPLADVLPRFVHVGQVTVLRDGEEVTVTVEGQEGVVGQLGVEHPAATVMRKKGLFASFVPALEETGQAAKLVYVVLRKFSQRDVPGGAKSLAGPLGILQLSAGAAAQGLAQLLRLVGLITVNIGVLNLLPLPPLDGGRLVFLGYEKVRGKAPNRRVQEIVFIAGIALLAFVLLWATKNDIGRIIDSLRTKLL